MPRSRQRNDVNVSFFAFQDIITAVTGILILIVILMVLMLRQPGVVEKIQVEPVETRSREEIESLISQALEKIRELAQIDMPTEEETETSLLASIRELESQLKEDADPLRAALLSDVNTAAAELETLKTNLSNLEKQQESLEETIQEIKETVAKRAAIVEESRDGDQVWLRMDPSDKAPIIVELDHQGGVLRDRNDPEVARRIASGSLIAELRKIAQTINGLESYFVFLIRPSGAEFFAPLKNMLTHEGIDLGIRPLGEHVELKIFDPEAPLFDE